MTLYVLGPKTINISDDPSVYEYDVVFDSTDFYHHTNYNQIQGPFSLALDINNGQVSPIYIGLSFERDNEVVTIADREHIFSIPAERRKIVTSASAPQLAEVNGTITKITVHIARFPIAGFSGTRITVMLRIDNAETAIAPATLIGKDLAALQPGQYESFDSGLVLIGADSTGNVVISPFSPSAPFRYRIISIELITYISTYDGDIHLYASMVRQSTSDFTVCSLYSSGSKIEHLLFTNDIFLTEQDLFAVDADNSNPAVDFYAQAIVLYEVIY